MADEIPPKVYCADIGEQFPFLVSSFRIADESVEEATCRVFKVGDISILVDLKDLCRRFGLEWSFVTRRSGKIIACNRTTRTCSYVNSGEGNRHLLRVVVIGWFVLGVLIGKNALIQIR